MPTEGSYQNYKLTWFQNLQMSYFRFEEEIDFGKGKGRLNDESIKKKT